MEWGGVQMNQEAGERSLVRDAVSLDYGGSREDGLKGTEGVCNG